ncbi:6-phosphofructokinase II [Psychromonas sp.]|nr:6-phosphofructokinase II [Psychromonas sp.]
MVKIITITLNPALDCSSTTPRIFADGKLRCSAPVFEPGGGGINVSRVIQRLGGESVAIYPAGGSSGENLNNLLLAEGIQIQPLTCESWTRQNLNVVTTLDNAQYRFIMPGANLTAAEQTQLISMLEAYSEAEYCIISGSIPDEMSENLVSNIIQHCRLHNIKVIFDGSGPALEKAVSTGVYLIKPNTNELAALTGAEYLEPEELEAKAREIISLGQAEVVLVSLGPQGALLVTESLCEQIVPPRVKKNSTVGAGDSMVGATIVALVDGLSIREATRRGVAAGTAATMNHGSELCKTEDVESIYQWILKKQPLN